MQITSSENLNKIYVLNINKYTFVQKDNNNSTIIITNQNDVYIVFNLNYDNELGNININNQKESYTINNNSDNKIKLYKNESIIITCSNFNENNNIFISNLQYYYNNSYNVVLITSKIYVSNKPLTYINTRSIYSSEQRLNQTLETINSIKKYIPNYFIVLFFNKMNLIKQTTRAVVARSKVKCNIFR